MEQLSFEEAKRLSIFKWEAHAKHVNGYNPLAKYDYRLEKLRHSCGFCERYKKEDDFYKYCNRCEFGASAGYCQEKDSLFDKWVKKASSEKAQAILDVIRNLNPFPQNGA